jgi:hypothetical protein
MADTDDADQTPAPPEPDRTESGKPSPDKPGPDELSPDERRPEQPAPDSEDDWAKDNLTAEDRRRQVGELRKIRARAATFGPGSAAFGGDQNQYFWDYHVHQSGPGSRWRTGAYDQAARQRLRDRFVRPASQDELDAMIRDGSIVVLIGGRGTGRRASALAALDRCCDQINDAAWDNPPGDLGSDDIESRNGYVWDASEAPWADPLTGPDVFGCRAALEYARAKLIVLVTGDCHLDPVVRQHAVRHRPVDGREILSGFLRAMIHDQGLVEDIMSRITAPPRSPQRASDLARDLEKGIADALRSSANVDQVITMVLQPYQDSYRLDARDVLRQKKGVPADEDLGRRSFMIAWAVLDGFPTAQICRAARELAERLFKIEQPGRNARLSMLPFGDILDEWLQHARENPPAYAEETDRRLQYRQGFAEAVLKAVWFDFVIAHKALLRWLKGLALDRDALVRLKAAHALGQLAVYDFDFIVGHCFRPWSAENRQALHDASAWALEEVVRRSPAHTKRIFELAEDWAKTTSGIYRQSAAVRLVGAALGGKDPQRSLRLLRKVALRPSSVLRMQCMWAMVEMFTMGVELPIIEQAREWAHSPRPELRGLAARCLIELSYLEDDGQPVLLAAFAQWPEQVGDLWRRVLVSRVAGQDPWNVLRRWHRRHIDFAVLRARLEAEDRLRGPLNWYLSTPRPKSRPTARSR